MPDGFDLADDVRIASGFGDHLGILRVIDIMLWHGSSSIRTPDDAERRRVSLLDEGHGV